MPIFKTWQPFSIAEVVEFVSLSIGLELSHFRGHFRGSSP